MSDVPVLFRVTLQANDIQKTAAFYAKLLGTPGREIRGGRHYFECGPVILAILDPSPGGEEPKPNPDVVYFSVKDLEAVFERAKALKCLSTEEFHEQKAGVIVQRPWGERSFYAEYPSGNALCFVDAKTLFTGK